MSFVEGAWSKWLHGEPNMRHHCRTNMSTICATSVLHTEMHGHAMDLGSGDTLDRLDEDPNMIDLLYEPFLFL